MKPKCELCGDRHDPHQAHVWPKSVATNRIATNWNATNNGTDTGRAGRGFSEELVGCTESVGGQRVSGIQPTSKTRNRRSREAYNAYQREYMRKRRKV